MKELINLRKQREKHFLNKDGTITACMYDHDIHYLENGEYKEIDNTLVEENEYITNKSNDFKIRFNNDKYLVNINLGNSYLNISLKNANETKSKIINNEVIYENVLPNIDFHYLINGSTLKENIYLNNEIKNSIIFNIDTNLELEIRDNKVLALDKDKVIYTFNPLFMIDANEVINRNCKYRLEKNNDFYELEIILDQDYLMNADYPVIIDPTITSDNLENVFDVTINSDAADSNFDFSKHLYIGNDGTGIKRALLKFDLPFISTGCNIIKATAHLKNSVAFIHENSERIAVHEITESWDESTATWNNMSNKFNTKVETHLETPQMLYIDTAFDFDITNIVKKWYTNNVNNGIMLKLFDESPNTSHADYSFYSKTYDGVNGTADRPYLVIEYRMQNGLLDYMTYESIPLSYGASYINNNNGNLITQISLSEILDQTSLYGLQITYSTDSMLLNQNNGFGLGFNISYNDYVIKTPNQFMETEYLYKLSDGTSHYFYQFSKGIFRDEDGINLTLEIVNEENNNYKITDKEGNKFIFTNSYLSKIEYVDETFVNIVRNSSNYITSIKDSKNNEVTINYNTNQVLLTCNNKTITVNLTNNKINNISFKKGNINFNYNDSSLISKIIDINGLGAGFDYYEVSPYRVKKLTEYGLNNATGKFKTFTYEFNSTTVTDHKNNKIRYTFNNMGNTISTVILGSDDSLKNSYGFSEKYIDEVKSAATNKVLFSSLPIKFTKNLIKNGNFETTDNNFLYQYRSNEDSFNGNYSAKINGVAVGEIPNTFESGRKYTIGAVYKNEQPINVQIYAKTNDNVEILEEYTIMTNTEYTYQEKTFESPSLFDLIGFKFTVSNNGIAYMDDVVISEGESAGLYNLIDNPDFEDNTDGWLISGNIDGSEEEISNPYQIITLSSNEKAIQLNSIVNGGVSMVKTLPISGKIGDAYTFSFWYKNEGVFNVDSGLVGNMAAIIFNDPDDDLGSGMQNALLNYHADNWQYYTDTCVAENNYDSITIVILSMYEANHISLTNFSLIKDLGSYSFEYDDNGNLITSINPDKGELRMKFDDNNQLIGLFDAKGNNFSYEYDNKKTNRVLKAISPTGISNEIKYDEFGNPKATIINNVNPKGNDIDGNFYIRSKGTDKYLTPNLQTGIISLKNDTCSHYSYSIESHKEINNQTETKVYNLKSTILPDKVLVKVDNTIKLVGTGPSTNFEFINRDNGSKLIKVYNEDLYLKVDDEGLAFAVLEENSNYEFYIEDTDTNEFIMNTFEYTDDGKYITKMVDTLGKKTIYNIGINSSLTDSIINPNGVETKYNYDEKDRLKSVEIGNKKTEYIYDNNTIKKIKSGNKIFEFEYDNFLNIKSIKINNNSLITNEFENNDGRIKNITYGNGNKICYEYDNFNRLIKTTKNNRIYERYYGFWGLLSKTRVDGDTEEYFNYDLSKRLSSYIYKNKFKINYKYDKNDNIVSREFFLLGNRYHEEYEYNKDDNITKVVFEDTSINYNYDNLGKLKHMDFSGNLPINFSYKRNGEKGSMIVNTMIINDDLYAFEYDNLYNLTGILKNGNPISEYVYDDRSQLLCDFNYEKNIKYVYKYDNEGNILVKQMYNLKTNVLINQDALEYGNTYWEDQLTKFNNEIITYDDIGNPLTIGNKSLKWINGRTLDSIVEGNNNINYFYNNDGIRVGKKVNNSSINYYLEGNKIIFEQRNNDIIYYCRDALNNLICFYYNGQKYIYQKNYLNDITGIYDSNYNLLVKYTYDAWGKVLSIKDNNDNEIADCNNIGIINPFRYRSYYYDDETKLYYLNSRYYNPEWCRFINSDGYLTDNIGSVDYNMFSYSKNNPITYIDIDGKAVFLGLLIGIVGVGAFAIGTTMITRNKAKKEIKKVQKKHKDDKRVSQISEKEFHDTIKNNADKIVTDNGNRKGIEKLKFFVGRVDNKSEYDLKRSAKWKDTVVKFDGIVMESQDIGNYNFGYIGRAMGYDVEFLKFGAGMKQLYDHNIRTIINCPTPSYCDDPRDSYFIQLGALKYDSDHSK